MRVIAPIFLILMNSPSFISALKENIPSNSHLIVGVSGGIDSMSLIHGLSSIRNEKGLIITGVHVDHGFREESHNDAKFTLEYLSSIEVDSVIVKLDKLPPNKNLEEFGREGRYSAFERIRSERKADWCLTAHHQGDLAETCLMQILFSRRVFGIQDKDQKRKIIRPLLKVEKKAIEEYARAHNVPWVEDPSNQSFERLRNQIRHSIIPFLKNELGEHVEPSLAASISEIGELAQGFTEYASSLIYSELSALTFGSKEWFRMSQELINRHPILLRPFILEELFVPVLGFRIGAKHRKRLYEFWNANSACIELPSGVLLKRAEGGIAVLSSQTDK